MSCAPFEVLSLSEAHEIIRVFCTLESDGHLHGSSQLVHEIGHWLQAQSSVLGGDEHLITLAEPELSERGHRNGELPLTGDGGYGIHMPK